MLNMESRIGIISILGKNNNDAMIIRKSGSEVPGCWMLSI